MVEIKSKPILTISLIIMILPWIIVGSLISSDTLNNDSLIEFLAKTVGIVSVIGLVGVLYSMGLFKKNK